jgi:two-component system CheB/CheR fusion protein
MAENGGNQRPLKVLVVEDDLETAQSLAEMVGRHGHDAQVVHDGRSAIRNLRDEDFQLVLLDIGLPDMDGYAVARRLTLLGRRGLSIVAMTGYDSDEDLRRSDGAGLDAHVVKPCNAVRLQQILLEAMAKAR